MKWITYALLLFCLVGCVDVNDGGKKPDPKPDPKKPDVTDTFTGADKELVDKILASEELKDSDRLRHYAALYKGAANVLKEQAEVPVPQVLLGISRATANFMKPRSPAMQQIVKSIMPESAGAESDRAKIAEKFDALSLACHAASYQLDTAK